MTRFQQLATGLVLLSSLQLAGCDLFTSPNERIARAERALQAHDFGAAAVDLKKVLQKDPANSRARMRLSECELGEGDVAAAAGDIARVTAAQVPKADYLRDVWRIDLAQRKFQEVASAVAAPVADFPESERLLLLARASFGLGRIGDAQTALREAAKVDPQNEEIIAALGSTLANTEGPAQAIAFLRAAATDHPKSFQIHRALADTLYRSGDVAGAEVEYRAARSLSDPQRDAAGYVTVSTGLVDTLLGQRKLDDAQTIATETAAKFPNRPFSLLLVGRVAAARRDFPTALEDLQRVLTADPDNASVRTMLAAVQLDTGRIEQATTNLKQVEASGRGTPMSHRLLAQAYLSEGRPEEAAKLLDAGDGVKQPPEVRLLRARALLAAGDSETALGILAQVEAETDTTDAARLDVATIYLQAGKADRALQVLGRRTDKPSARRDRLELAALAAKDKAAGILALKAYASKNSDEPAELEFAALALTTLGESAPALDMLASFSKTHPGDAQVLATLAQVQARSGHLDDADATLRHVLELKPSTSIRLALAQLASARKQPADVVHWLQEARSNDPKSTTARSMLARVFLEEQKPDDAQKVVDELLALDSTSVEPRLLAAAISGARKNDDKALEYIEQALKIAPTSGAAWYAKAQLHLHLKQDEDARLALRRAIEYMPRAPEPLMALVRLEVTTGNSARAYAVARSAEEHPDSRALGLALEGDLLMHDGKAAEAVPVYETLMRSSPNARNLLALYQARSKAHAPAPEATLSDWLKSHPGDVVVRSALAESWQRNGQPARAIAEYEAGLKVDPNAAGLLNNLAWAYSEAHDPRALATAQRAYELAPKNAAIADTLGWILLNGNQPAEGVKLLKAAVAMAPNALDLEYHLATGLIKTGDKAGAKAICDQYGSAKVPDDWRKKFAALGDQARSGG